MSQSKSRTWIVGTAFLSLVLMAAAWLLGISPLMEEAAAAADEAATVEAQNLIQAQRLATLRQQAEQLDDYRAELASLQAQIPSELELSPFLREINDRAAAAGVTVLSLVDGTPVDFFPAPAIAPVDPAAVEPAEGEAESGDAGTVEDGAPDDSAPATGTAPATDQAGAAPQGVNGLVAVPVTMTVLGTYDAATAFVEGVQTGMTRLFVVTSYQIIGQDEAEASNGRPATKEGDAELTLNGYIYVMKPGATLAASTPAAGADGAATPAEDETVVS